MTYIKPIHPGTEDREDVNYLVNVMLFSANIWSIKVFPLLIVVTRVKGARPVKAIVLVSGSSYIQKIVFCMLLKEFVTCKKPLRTCMREK